MWILQLLNEPYPLNSVRKMTWMAAYVSIFVFLFLTFFQPFGINVSDAALLVSVTASYGLITFATIVMATFVVRGAFPSYFQEQNWTFGRELIITTLNFVLIGIFNLIYSNYKFKIGLSISQLLYFQLYTIGVGIFPILFFMMLKYTRLLRTNMQEAQTLSNTLSTSPVSVRNTLDETILIHSELKNDDLTMLKSDFVYAETADNYMAVYHLNQGELQKTLVRTTLSKLETDLGNFPKLVRCHRAFFVNLDHLESFKGNAQGLQLSLRHVESQIPVSRKMVGEIKSLLG